ncbi:MAG TPA: hypothetical protein VM097_03230 [Mycobacteriales bacterium]|nr:hypothetical protein [Mycobacteriales bacterium]
MKRVGKLALVRTGAVYRDPATNNIWFHPWGGSPRVVGHGTPSGPGGDPQGDVAAWFDGKTLVVYDTVGGKVLSRSREVAGVRSDGWSVEHLSHGNGFMHVSAQQVIWASTDDALGRRDLVARTSALPWQARPPAAAHRSKGSMPASLLDVSPVSAVWFTHGNIDGSTLDTYFLVGPGTYSRPITGLESPGILSADGSWLLTAELADGTHGVAITDVRTGEAWRPFTKATYAFFSWSYGDVAVMRVNPRVQESNRWSLVACYVVRRVCKTLGDGSHVLLPNP